MATKKNKHPRARSRGGRGGARPALARTGTEVTYTERTGEVRDALVSWRLNTAERDRLHAHAARKGLTLAKYLRALVALDANDELIPAR